MDNDFLVKIMAMLETKGIKDDYEKIKQMFLKDPTKINTVMDMSATKTEINKFIKEYAPKLQEMFSNLGVKGINVKDIESSLKTIFSSYQKELKNMPKIIDRAYGSNNKLNDSMEITKNRAKGASQSFQSYIKSLKPIALKQYSNEINQISDSFSKASESGKSIDLSKANSHLSKFKSEMKNAGMETATLTQKLKENIGAFSQWYFIGNAIGSLVRNFKASINTIKEVDTYLTEISKTSEISAENLKKLGIDAFDYASKYGSTVGAYLSGVQEMSRAGYDESIAKGLAELSILAQSAGDMTAELANEYLIATNAAYKYDGNVKKLNDVLDSQNQVTNRNAITMSKLAEATKIAGSQAASSGVEVDELTAAITTMGVVTQAEGGVLGRAFRGILMNLQQVKGELENGEIIDEESFTKVEKAADALGVKLKETRDGVLALRDPMQILKELAEEYSKLAEGDVRGANLISSLGGKYRGNQLVALLDNWEIYEKVLNDYKNASGSAAEEAQKTADSIEGRLNKLTNTWNRTVANVVDSDLIKAFVSTGTSVTDLIDKLDLLQTGLIALGGVATYKGLTSLVSMLRNAATSTLALGNALNTVKNANGSEYYTTLTNAIRGLSVSQAATVLSTQKLSKAEIAATMINAGFSAEQSTTTASTLAMSSSQVVATGTTITLSGAMRSLGAVIAANPIGVVITALTIGYSAFSFISNKVKQDREELLATSKQITDEYKHENQAIDEQVKKYKELSEQLNDSNTSISDAKNIKDQLYTIQSNLIDSYGLEAEGLDLVNGKYKEQIGLLDELSKDKAQEYLAENRKAFQTADSELNKTRYYDLGNLKYGDNLIEYLKDYQKNEPSLDVLNDTYAYRTGQKIIRVSANVEEADKVLHQLYNDIESYGKSTGEDVSGILDNISEQLGKTWTDELKTHKDNYDAYIEAQVVASDTLRPLYKESIDAVETYNKALASGEGIEEAKSNLDDVKNKVAQNTNEVEGSQKVFDDVFSKIATGAQQTGEEIKDNFTFPTESFDTLNKSLDDLDKKSKDAVSSVKELNQVLYDQSQGTKLTSEQAYKLITQYPQLASALEKTTDGYTINEEAIENVRLALINQEEANANAQLNMTKDTLNAVSDRVEAYGIELESITTLQSALNEQSKLPFEKIYGSMEGFSFDDATKRITTPRGSFIADSTSTVYDSIKGAYQEQKLIHDTIGKMGNLQERINGLQNDLISDEGFGVNEGKGGSGKEDTKDYIKEAFDLGIKDKKGNIVTEGKNDLDHKLAMEEITQKQYLDGLEKINKATYGKNKKTHLEQYRQYVAEVYKGRKKIDEDNIKSKFDDLSHSFAMGDIKTEEDYQKQRWELAKDYYKNNKDYLGDWKKAQEEWYKWNLDQTEKSTALEQKKRLNTIDKIIDKYGELRDTINKTAENQTGDAQVSTYSEGIKYANKEIKYIEKEIKKLNKRKITNLFTQDDYDSQLANLQSALSKARSSIDNFNKSISESIKKSSEETMDIIEKSFNKTTEYWENQKKDYSDIIKAQKDILQLKKEQNEYEKSIAKKTKEISKIESRMADLSKAAMTGDRQANAELKKLEEDLADKKEDLSDTQSDHEYDLANDALDKALDDNDKIIDAKLKAIKTEYEERKTIQEDLFKQLETLTTNAKNFTIAEYSAAIDEIAAKFAQSGIMLDDTTIGGLKGAQGQPYNNANPVYSILGNKSNSNMSQDTSSLSGLNKFLASQGYSIANKDKMVQLAQALGLYNITSPDMVGTDKLGRANKNLIMEELKRLFSGSTFSKGGIAKLPKMMGEDGFALIKNGEPILTVEQGKLFKELVNNIKPLNNLVKLSTPNISNITNRTNSPNINITIPIAGNANPSTVSALNNAGNNIVKQIMDEVRKL